MYGILPLYPETFRSTLRRADLGYTVEELMTADLLPTVVSNAGITVAFMKFSSIASGSGIDVAKYAAPANGCPTGVIHIR